MQKEDLLQLLINGTDSFTPDIIIFNLIITTLLSLFIYFIYKKTFVGVLYSQNFNVTLIMIAMVTSIVMMLIGSNLAISLGMVGALSIVRFRAAVKDPRDIAFLFWAIAVGLASGTGAFMIAILGSLFISILLLLFCRLIYVDSTYLLILKGPEVPDELISQVLKTHRIPYKLKMQLTSSTFTESTYEINLKKLKAEQLIKEIKTFDTLDSVHLVSYNGEVSG